MTQPSTPALPLLDELDELRAKATPGLWVLAEWSDATILAQRYLDSLAAGEPEEQRPAFLHTTASNAADAALIVAAVNRLPELTAALRAVLTEHDGRTCCDRTFESMRGYEPCPTVAAITTALEAS